MQDPLEQRRQEAELARLARVKKRAPHPIDPLGPALADLRAVFADAGAADSLQHVPSGGWRLAP